MRPPKVMRCEQKGQKGLDKMQEKVCRQEKMIEQIKYKQMFVNNVAKQRFSRNILKIANFHNKQKNKQTIHHFWAACVAS